MRAKSSLLIVLTISSIAIVSSLVLPARGSTILAASPHIVDRGFGEPDVAINPLVPNNLVYSGTGVSPPPYYSQDGGSTWTHASAPSPLPPGANGGFWNDPQVAFDLSGNAYMGWAEATLSNGGQEIALLKSTDNGKSYSFTQSPPISTAMSFRWPDGTFKSPCTSGLVIDSPKLNVDRSPSSPFRNSLYVTAAVWFNVPGTGCFPFTSFVRSTDGGVTWRDPQVPATNYIGSSAGGIGVSVNGTIYLARSGCASGNGLQLEKSTNGGQGFTDSCVFNQPSVLVAGGPVAVASANDPTRVWVGFGGVPSGSNYQHVFVIASPDAGATWGTPVRVDDVLTNDNVVHFAPSLSMSVDGRLDLEWFDQRNTSNSNFADVYYSWSYSGGTTWGNGTNVRLTPNPGCFNRTCSPGNDFMTIVSSGPKAYAAYALDTDNDNINEGFLNIITFTGFGVSVNPTTALLNLVGSSTTANVNVASLNGFAGTVSLSTSPNPSGLVVSLWPYSLVLSSGGSAISTMSISAGGALPGNYSLTVSATNGTLVEFANMFVTVKGDFSLSASPAVLTIQKGSSTATAITVASLNGFSGTVDWAPFAQISISATTSDDPTCRSFGLLIDQKLDPQFSVTQPSSVIGTGCGTFSFFENLGFGGPTPMPHFFEVGVNAAVGHWHFTISLNSNPVASVDSDVNHHIHVDFDVGAIFVTSLSGGGNTPTASWGTFTTVSAGGTAADTMTVSTSSQTTPGKYNLTWVAASGLEQHSVTVIVNVVDFDISASPTSLTMMKGTSASATITLSSLGPFQGPVSLSAIMSPVVSKGPTVSLSSSNVLLSPGGSATNILTVFTRSSTPAGTYTVSVTGTSGSLSHSVTVTVTVTT